MSTRVGGGRHESREEAGGLGMETRAVHTRLSPVDTAAGHIVEREEHGGKTRAHHLRHVSGAANQPLAVPVKRH